MFVGLLLLLVLGGALGALGIAVVARRPVPEWLVVAVPATLAGGGSHGVFVAGMVAGVFGAVAAFAAWVRPGPDAGPPRRPWVAVAALGVGTVASGVVNAALGTTQVGTWSCGALAVALAFHRGAVPGAVSGYLARAGVVTSAAVAVFAVVDHQRDALGAIVALGAALAVWIALGRRWSAISTWSLLVGVVPLLIAGHVAVGSAVFELVVRVRGQWDELPVVSGPTSPLDCVPSGRGTLRCRYGPARVVRADDVVPPGPLTAFVARDPGAWGPWARVRVVDLGAALPETPTVRLLGGGRVEPVPGHPFGPEGDVAVEPAGGTYADLAQLCGPHACKAWRGAEPEPWDVDDAVDVAGAVVFALLVAGWIRRTVVDTQIAPSSALPAAVLAGALILPAPQSFGTALALPLAVSVGLAAGARAIGAGRMRPGEALAALVGIGALPLVPWAFAGTALSAHATVLGLQLATPCLLVGVPGPLRLRLAGWNTAGIVVPLGVLAVATDRHDVVARMPAALALFAALIALPTFPAAIREHRWVDLGATAVALTVAAALGVVGIASTTPFQRNLSALDRPDLPTVPRPGLYRWVPTRASCAPGAPPRDLATGQPCDPPDVAVLPADAPAEQLLDPNVRSVVVRSPSGVDLRGVDRYLRTDGWGPPVLLHDGMTVQDVLDVCGPYGTCVLVPVGVRGVP